jgi:phage terminase large subunit GpA-like protein
MTLQNDNVEVSTPEALALLSTRLDAIRRQLLTPPMRCSLSEWCDTNRYLGYGSSEPGLWRTSRAPYQKEPLDIAGDQRTQRMVIMAAAQTMKTSVLENVIAYYMAHDPCPIMAVMPDNSMAESFSMVKLEPMIEESPALRTLVASKSKRDGGNKKLEKLFPGGFVTLVSSKSAHSLRSRSIRVLLLDEVDAYEASIGDEGDPIRLAEARTTTWPNRKIILTSTPTLKDISRIEREFLASDQRYFNVPSLSAVSIKS